MNATTTAAQPVQSQDAPMDATSAPGAAAPAIEEREREVGSYPAPAVAALMVREPAPLQ